MENDKQTEYQRYNQSSKNRLTNLNEESLLLLGSANFPEYLRSPYIYYEQILGQLITKESRVLDLCCGDGIHTIRLGLLSDDVTATDIAENSVELARIRAKSSGVETIKFISGDAENLKFPDLSFDVITCIGSISYLNLETFVAEVLRVLRPGGKFVAVDSFNHNPVYRLNRFFHYLRGLRSKSTLDRMPDIRTVKYLERKFESVEVRHFGIFAFAGPILSKIFGSEKTRRAMEFLDESMKPLRKYSFKIVIIATK